MQPHGSDEHYDPGADAAHRFSDWVVRHRRIAPISEVLCLNRRVILIERDATPAQRRSALAHALAHLDLGHVPGSGRVERRHERAADALAASRLIPLDRLADVLTWALGPDEVADELDVTERLVRARVLGLTGSEKAYISERVERMGEVA